MKNGHLISYGIHNFMLFVLLDHTLNRLDIWVAGG